MSPMGAVALPLTTAPEAGLASPPGEGDGAVAPARSLQTRITAAILVTVVVVLAIGCSLFMVEQRHSEQVREAQVAQHLAESTAAIAAGAFAPGAAGLDRRDVDTFFNFDRIKAVSGYDATGLRRFVYRRSEAAPADSATFVAPVMRGGRRIGEMRMLIGPPPNHEDISRYLAVGGALFFAATALALFIGRWLAARITNPVARLSIAMDYVGRSGELAIRVPPQAPDEIGRLTLRFNQLLKRLHIKDQALRRAMGELMEARDAAEAANVAKSQFLANMSHEIRTPLNGVLAMAQVLEQGAADGAQRNQAKVIRQSGETLLSLLNDMLDVSKIESGRLELEAAEFDFEPTVRGALAGFAAVAERKGLGFTVQVEDAARGRRLGDPARVRQILSNFVSNALKFTERGGVTVTVAGEGAAGADGVRMTVKDTGIGIPPEKLSMVFQRFVQVDASTTRRFGGTGLGLAICEELSALMGGRVWVESRLGEGASFHASLPLARTAALAEAAFEPDPAIASAVAETDLQPDLTDEATAPLKVLAAEDNPTNQLVLRTVMQIFGVDLTLAADGREAVERWREGGFDIVLMDIQMPVMDGVAATRAIRSLEAAEGRPHTPILALSANALPQQVQEYMAAGMDGHVAKPIELERLQAALEAVMAPPAASRVVGAD